MKVILLENIAKLGGMGEQVHVKSGYGRNFLIPKRKAIPATPANMKEFEAKRVEYEKLAAESLAAAQQRAAKLADMKVQLAVKAGDEGKLYGAVTTRDVAEAISAAGVAVEKREVSLPASMRALGDYTVKLRLHAEVISEIAVELVAE